MYQCNQCGWLRLKDLWIHFSGRVYRAINPRWSYEPTSGAGAALFGGRFNPPGTPALYTSLRFETAWLEAQQGFPLKSQPLTICTYQVDIENILDLTDPTTCGRLSISQDDLACAWRSLHDDRLPVPTWELARLCNANRTRGIIAPSFAVGAGPQDRNLILWQWSDSRPSQVVVIDDEGRLPRNPDSWH
ncbi:RES family NAD+ phosphorylase [Allohahella marinimesophila]|uniref:RES family NAD+ phosphorylase n=1 Tax=Allohahella marinimesophila TaxID=1054972 RepID=UPI003CD06C4F